MGPEPLGTDPINISHIRVAGIGGLGLVAMAAIVAWYVPGIRVAMAVALPLGILLGGRPDRVAPPLRKERSMLGGKTWDQWIAQYAQSHQHPVNRFCHTLGIPLIALSLPLFAVAAIVGGWWALPISLFVAGWIFQFVGHAVEGKPPEFFHDWRFLFVGLRWWFAKMRGRA